MNYMIKAFRGTRVVAAEIISSASMEEALQTSKNTWGRVLGQVSWLATAHEEPVITVLERTVYGTTRYRISGGSVAPEWLRDGRQPWCDFSIYHDSDQLSGFGGEVWPLAWPHLFVAPYESRPTTFLTNAGKAAIAAAREQPSRPWSSTPYAVDANAVNRITKALG